MTVRQVLETASKQLRQAGSSSPRLLAHPEHEPTTAQHQTFDKLLARRAASEPMAYVLGEREFYGRIFKTDRRALIPRPETELLVEIGCQAVAGWRAGGGVEPRVVEVGTGAGAVAVSLAAETGAPIVATEISWAALSLARENAQRLSQAELVHFVLTDVLSGIRGPLHVILANLPYVPSGRTLPPDIANYEPAEAIFGGPTGTEILERLLHQARTLLAPGGELALELDESGQAEPMSALAAKLYPAADIRIRQDAGGYERVLWLRR
jgi:release factor glutamine methyltransferase